MMNRKRKKKNEISLTTILYFAEIIVATDKPCLRAFAQYYLDTQSSTNWIVLDSNVDIDIEFMQF